MCQIKCHLLNGGMEANFKQEVLRSHRNKLLHILEASDVFANYSVYFDFLKLFDADPDLGNHVLNDPLKAISDCDIALVEAQKCILDVEPDNPNKILTLKPNTHARFDLPSCPEIHRNTIPKNEDLGCFIKITGTAVRLTQSKMLEYRRDYKCVKCHYVQSVEGMYENRFVIKAPVKCKNPETPRCRSSTFSAIQNISRDNCKDYQEMKLQEQVNKFTVGGIPGSIWVTLDDDLVDCCKPGDDVNISGVIMRRWYPLALNKKCEVELVMKANHIEVCNSQKAIALSVASGIQHNFNNFWISYKNYPMKGRDVILASICPKVYGLYMVKLALTLTVITGCIHDFQSNETTTKNLASSDKSYESSVRGQCHLLLVGDPGTGKSQLLKAAAVLTPRSVLTSGSGTTKAGLTCTALRENGEWQLEAGALVLADGGTCCIDELTQMKEHDRASIHEAMEQQTISVAKAGIVCKLNSRCAVVAACNPKGNYDTDQPLNVNVSLATPLLSRFDLIFILLDKKHEEWDNALADYILFNKEYNDVHINNWHLEKLQTYLSLVGRYQVKITPTATTILQAYYMSQRRAVIRDPSRTTVRMLDSLIRLSQAHARLMFRKIVLPMDAIVAISLMDLSMQDCLLSGSSNVIQTTFHECPDFVYLKTAQAYLTNFGLHNIWEGELLFYAQLLQTDKQTLCYNLENDNFELFKCGNDTNVNTQMDNIIESTYFRSETDNILKNEFFHRDKCAETQPKIKQENIFNDSHENVDTLFTDKNMLEFMDSLENDNRSSDDIQLNNVNLKKDSKKKAKVKFQLDTSDENLNETENNPPNKKKKTFNFKKNKISSFKSSVNDTVENKNHTDNLQILNHLPSVNDIYNELNISFDFDNDVSNEEVQENINKANIDAEKRSKPQIFNKTKLNAHEKLQKFSFSARINKNQKQDVSPLNDYKITSQSQNECTESISNNSQNIPSTSCIESSNIEDVFHESIFENDDDLDFLNI